MDGLGSGSFLCVSSIFSLGYSARGGYDLTIKLSLMKSISLIARAIYANEQNNSYNFTRKRELLVYMQDLIKLEPMDVLRTPIRQHAMLTCSHLLYPLCPHTAPLGYFSRSCSSDYNLTYP
ncbi:hypothetical protein chiPu_0023459, partial [Chiloscyllium punctatum]|nr:hypothetical protein [Chiloscyllium punctatum]